MRRLRRALYASGQRAWTALRYRSKVWRLQRRLPRKDLPVSLAAARGYWRQHFGVGISTRWHFVYAQQTGRDDERYVPEDVFYDAIEPVLNEVQLHRAYADKNFYGRWLPEEVLPEAVLRAIHGRFYTYDFLAADPTKVVVDGPYFIKPSLMSGGGRQVEPLSVRDGVPYVRGAATNWEELRDDYRGNFILQRPLVQHPALAVMNSSSINTLRIMTLRLDETIVLSTVVRVGGAGSHVDNMTSGGAVVCGINTEGRLNPRASDRYDNRVAVHPDTGYHFGGQEIPAIHAAWDLVKRLHPGLPYFDLASWDVSIDPTGRPTLVEVNLRGQEISFHQVNNGPLFGARTEEVLHYIRRLTPAALS